MSNTASWRSAQMRVTDALKRMRAAENDKMPQTAKDHLRSAQIALSTAVGIDSREHPCRKAEPWQAGRRG